ncbi:hypothetical protein BLSTO_03629 [Blastocystis sp. subtype 1]
MLNVIGNSINKLQSDLDTMGGDSVKYKLNDREIKRRQNLIEGLKREKKTCDTNFEKNGGHVQVKNQLLNTNYDADSLTKQSDVDLHHMQEQTFAAQEEALVDISDTLGRLHEIGTTIGQEVDLQTKLLDEIDTNVSNANNRMKQETLRTKKVAKNSGMCKWYAVIVLLLIILIYLIIAYIKK